MPGSPAEWYDLGVFFRMNNRFGEAINAFSEAVRAAEDELSRLSADIPDASASGPAGPERIRGLERIRASALASIDLLKEINGFVNTDLMNP